MQCWGELLLKVMRYNVALLPKKVTNYVCAVLGRVTLKVIRYNVALLPKKVTNYVCAVLGRVTFKSNTLQCCVTP